MNNDPTTSAVSVLVATGLCSLWGIFWALKQGRMISATAGLHLNALLLVAIGPIIYVLTDPLPERLPFFQTVSFITNVAEYFLIGYVFWSVIEWFLIVQPNRIIASRRLDIQSISMTLLVILSFMSLVGYLAAQLAFATSGIGTIIIVMKNFMYPCLLSILLRTRWRHPSDVFIAVVWSGCVLILSSASPWRSDLVVSGFCLLLYISIRIPRLTIPLLAVGLMLFWIVLPTLQFKKENHDEFSESPLSAIVTSQKLNIDERTSLLFEFAGTRLNYTREMAYAERGVELGMTNRLEGQSYSASVYQLIPRVIWLNKPSYNHNNNFTIPREIGLLAWNDPGTSWGLNAYAESIINFPVEYLVLFVPLLFLLFHFIELYALKLMKTSSSKFLLSSSLFFLTISLVGLVNLGTFILWCIIFLAIVDFILVNIERKTI